MATSADTAAQVWGGEWHMPTRAQMQELTANTTYEWTTINGVNGGKFTATNGNYVFFPAAGGWYDDSFNDVGSSGYYWASSPDDSDDYGDRAWYLYFGNDYNDVGGSYRNDGCSVRPVIEPGSVYIFATSSNLQSLEARVAALEAYHTT